MSVKDMKQRTVQTHDFSMIPRADIPRSSFPILKGWKAPFSAAYLVPIFVEEALPGDAWNVGCTVVARTATPIVPIMDNWHLETFFFFVPNRLVWTNWYKFMGEQVSPGDSISFSIPQVVSAVGGFTVASLQDYMGLPTAGQIGGGATLSVNVLPMRAYNLIYNQWFRDENLQNYVGPGMPSGDGPDAIGSYQLQKRGKRHDYFTSCLPWPQKGTATPLIVTGQAIVKTNATNLFTGPQTALKMLGAVAGAALTSGHLLGMNTAANVGTFSTPASGGIANEAYPSNLYADLSTATQSTINQLRQSFQIQKLLERDARGGTRYKEIILSHFGVLSPDARLDRPEYIGGGHVPVLVSAIPQTSATGLTGGTTPAGSLAATGSAQGRNGFSYSATEHGYIIGLANVRADLTYSQGLRRHWSRLTRYDYYFPAFAALGEQAVLSKEIYCDGGANDNDVFGYQERWAEYRMLPSEIRGIFAPRAAGNIAYWNSTQNFAARPTLNTTFITDDTNTVMQRNFSAGAASEGQQFLCDILFTGKMVRPLPKYSVPGLIDHF